MKIETDTEFIGKYRVFNDVWAMVDNKPEKLEIHEVHNTADLMWTGIHHTYVARKRRFGANNNNAIHLTHAKMFNTKEELLDSLK